MPDLFPTPTRLALLRDVAAGLVCDTDELAPHLDIGEDGTTRVAEAIWAMERAGWVVQPSDRLLWELTDAGRALLEEADTDA